MGLAEVVGKTVVVTTGIELEVIIGELEDDELGGAELEVTALDVGEVEELNEEDDGVEETTELNSEDDDVLGAGGEL